MKKDCLLVINSKVLPSVFAGVIDVKDLLAEGKAKNVSEAVKIAGISRSAFYKYKDYVFKLNNTNSQMLKIEATLSDKAGVFSSMTKILSENGANIVTINQGAPTNGLAPVTLSVCIDNVIIPAEQLLGELKATDGIMAVKFI